MSQVVSLALRTYFISPGRPNVRHARVQKAMIRGCPGSAVISCLLTGGLDLDVVEKTMYQGAPGLVNSFLPSGLSKMSLARGRESNVSRGRLALTIQF
jgi:hypothetical protein